MLRTFFDAPLVPVAMFVGAVVGCGYVMIQLILAAIAARWPTVEGEIVGAYLIQQGIDARGLQERVTYRYHVAGRPFLNDRVRIGPQPQRVSIVPATGFPAAMNTVAGRYPVGQRVLVRYNPRRPQDSVLHAQPNLIVAVIFVAAVVNLYLGARALFPR